MIFLFVLIIIFSGYAYLLFVMLITRTSKIVIKITTMDSFYFIIATKMKTGLRKEILCSDNVLKD